MKELKLACTLFLAMICLSGCVTQIKGRSVSTDNMHVLYPQVTGLKKAAIQDMINKSLYSTAFKLKEEYATEVKRLGKDYTYSVQYEIAHNNKGLISIRYLECLSLLHYAHPINKICAVTANLGDGMIYALKDIFLPGSRWQAALNKIIKDKIKKNGILLLSEFKEIDNEQEFYITKDELAIYWQEGTYLPRYLGPFTVLIDLSSIKDLLRKDITF